MHNICKKIDKNDIPLDLSAVFCDEEILFDIETTGLSAKTSHLYLIGCCYWKEQDLVIQQFFCENSTDEQQALTGFSNLCKNFKQVISFNGDTFDIPYLEEKYGLYNVSSPFTSLSSCDLYKLAKKYKHILRTGNLKQKTIESALGLFREDPFTGKELIDKYKMYLKYKDPINYDALLLHNYEDVLGMLYLFTLRSIDALSVEADEIQAETMIQKDFDGNATPYLILHGKQKIALTASLSYKEDDFYMVLQKEGFHISVAMKDNQVKLPYFDYKDYVYLPLEDMAIPKVLASGVPKNEQLKATKSNCYGKKNVDDAFLKDKDMLKQYCEKIITYLLKNHK